MSTPLLETPRLMLREICSNDAEAIFHGWAQDEEVTRFLTWLPHQSISDTKDYLHAVTGSIDTNAHTWVICLQEQVIGSVRLDIKGHRAEFGYVLAKPHWAQGIMSEAVRAVIDFAFSLPSVHRVWAVCDVQNPGSAKVMQKSGMQEEGILRGWMVHPNFSDTPRDCFSYSILKDD